MKKAKSVALLTFTLLLSAANFSSVLASDVPSSTGTTETESENRSEVTEYRYMYVGTKLYKRLWSVTYNHWIDPAWTPA